MIATLAIVIFHQQYLVIKFISTLSIVNDVSFEILFYLTFSLSFDHYEVVHCRSSFVRTIKELF